MTLLGVSGADKKIYPSKPPTDATLPYMLYFYGVGDQTDEHIDEDRIQITVRGATKSTVGAIRNRVKLLLDKSDDIQSTTMATDSTEYHIYYCRFSGGDGFWEPETEIWNSVLFFNVKYMKKD